MKVIVLLVLAALCWQPLSWAGDKLNESNREVSSVVDDPATRQILREVWQQR